MFLTTDYTDDTDFGDKIAATASPGAGAIDLTWRCTASFCVFCVFVYQNQSTDYTDDTDFGDSVLSPLVSGTSQFWAKSEYVRTLLDK